MNLTESSQIYQGSCHCGKVQFQVLVTNHRARDCNCSICYKKGFIHCIVPLEHFSLHQGEEALSTYTFSTKIAKHTFCSHCGIHPFYYPRSHPDCIDVNVRCLTGNVLSNFVIEPFDGQNWEDNIEQIRFL
jgi:hypothetical protein